MYKSLKEKIKKLEKTEENKISSTPLSFAASEEYIFDLAKNITVDFRKENNKEYYEKEEVVDMLKNLILKKSEEYKGIEEQILEKNWKKAFKTGLSLLGLIHGAHYVGQDGGLPTKQPEEIKTMKIPNSFRGKGVKPEMKRSPSGELANLQPINELTRSQINTENNKKSHGEKINQFLEAIALNETSGGKNLKHKTMRSGMHRGDTAIGQYGLMPNTVQEMAGRIRRDLGSDHPLAAYKKMDEKQMRESFKQNPEHEEDMARFMANHVHKKYDGNENKMAWSWLNGHNTTNFPEDYKNHYYVKKYNKHIGQVRKPKKQE